MAAAAAYPLWASLGPTPPGQAARPRAAASNKRHVMT
jgi:hypothetical protein